MGIGTSIFLLAAGAILAFAVKSTSIGGIDLQVIGLILMAAGVLGIVLFLAVFAPRNRAVVRRDETVVRDRDGYRDRDRY